MRVRLVQSGGFAGIVKSCEVDTSILSPDQAEELERLVRASGISGSGAYLSATARDLSQYEITIEDGRDRLSVVFDDASVPEAARAMLAFLKARARPQPLR